MKNRACRIGAAVALAVGFSGAAANAATYTTIDLTPYANDSWSGTFGVSSFPTGAQTLNGTPFQIASDANGARYVSSYMNSASVFTFNTNIVAATSAYSLINTIWGQPGPNSYLSLTFTGAGGFTQTFNLVGDVDIRDFHNFSYTNTINNTSTVQVVNTDDGQHRLDEQTFALDPAFLTQNLVSVTMTDTGHDSFQRGALTGLTIASNPVIGGVPEPASWAMLLAGFAMVGAGARYRRRTIGWRHMSA